MSTIGRNDPCHCGSGKKYKKCCLAQDESNELDQVKKLQPQFSALDSEEYPDVDKLDDEALNELDDEYFDEFDEEEQNLYEGLNDEEIEIVDDWWDTYVALRTPEKELMHVKKFMKKHPKLVPYLALHKDVLFDLGSCLRSEDKFGDYISLLLEIQTQFPEVYKECESEYNKDIITWLLSENRKDEIDTYLQLYVDEPVEYVDQFFELKNLFLATNNAELILPVLIKTHQEVCSSDEVLNPYAMLNPLIITLLESRLGQFNAAEFLELIKEEIKIELDEEYCQPEYWDKYVKSISRPIDKWNDKLPTKYTQAAYYYQSICENFMWFLKKKTGISMASAEFLGFQVNDYLSRFLEKNKKPKKLFNFSKNVLDKKLGEICGGLFFNYTKFAATLNAIYYFADYLCECGNINDTEKEKIKSDITGLYNDLYPKMRLRFVDALVFKEYPLF